MHLHLHLWRNFNIQSGERPRARSVTPKDCGAGGAQLLRRPEPGPIQDEPQMRYDPSNIFAKILRGELPAHKVYETDHVLAFMDIMPRGEGPTLVLPKAAARNILDVEPDVLAGADEGGSGGRESRLTRRSTPTVSRSSSSTRAPAGRWSFICMCTSSRASRAFR